MRVKRDYLVVYDYQTGGVWAIIAASSVDEIVRRFPELQIVEHRPSWLDEKWYEQIRSKNYYDIDNIPSNSWLGKLDKTRP